MAPRRVPPHILKADSYIHPMTGGTSESAYAHTESRLLHPMTGGTAKNAYAHTESRLFFTWHSGPHCWHSRPQCWHSRPQEGELGAYNICFCFCLLDRQNVFTSRRVWRRKHGGLAASMVDYGNWTIVKSAQDIETNCTHN